MFRYEDGDTFQEWQKENAEAGRPHCICCAMEFLHNGPDEDILAEALARLNEYLHCRPGKFSTVACSETEYSFHNNSGILLIDVACDFRNNDVPLFLDTVAVIFSMLMFIHDRHTTVDAVRFNKYQIAYYPWNDDEYQREIYRIRNEQPFEEIIYQLRNTFQMKRDDDLTRLVCGVEDTHFFSYAHDSDIYRDVLPWVQRQERRKQRIPMKWSVNNIAKTRLSQSNVLTVSRFRMF